MLGGSTVSPDPTNDAPNATTNATNDALRAQIDELIDACVAGYHEVDAAIESGEKERQLAAGRSVDELAQRYRTLRDAQTGPARGQVERALDRRVTDLRRSAAALVQRVGGHRAQRAVDAGFVPFLEQRSPSSGPAPAEWPTLEKKRLGVGTEIESWCGKCKEMRTHSIVAMVGDVPKQVICQTCNSKHNHRAEPPARARSTQTADSEPQQSGRERTRREELRRDLQRELNASIEVRAFDPKGVYSRGEIISHPQYGRGKVENVLNGSILVRFLEGLRPLDVR
jgi:hypothetical protein